jgi:hemerythrin-like domain-containing protein
MLKSLFNTPPRFPAHAGFAEQSQAYCDICRQHITLENKELLSMAQHILSSRQLEDLGRAMARRRGQRY